MNIEKYLNNITRTLNGVVYKDVDAFMSHIGICYIGEGGLNHLEEYLSRGEDLTDEQIVSGGIGSTYESILAECEEHQEELFEVLGEDFEDIDLNHCAEYVFDSLDWCYVSTEIENIIDWG